MSRKKHAECGKLPCLQGGVSGAKRVANPFYGVTETFVRFYRDDVEAYWAFGELWALGQEQRGGTNQFFLFAVVDGQSGRCPSIATAITDFGKNEAAAVLQHEVDFPEATAEVLCNVGESLPVQKATGE